MPPSACLIDPPPADDLLAPLSALFSPLFYISPIPDAGDGRILPLSPPLDEASALRLKEIAAALSSGEAARHGERLRGLVAELLDGGADEPESGREVIRTLRRGGTPDGNPLLRERLTLLLAAQARREQAELERELARIRKRHRAVFAGLREDDAEMRDAAVPTDADAATSPDRQAYLRAWLRLLEHTPLPCPNPWFITFDAALAAALLTEFRQGGSAPVVLPPISLPADGATQNGQDAETPCLFAVLREAE